MDTKTLLRIRIRMLLRLLARDPDLLERDTDKDPEHSIIKQI
jgi:hypothetical protein